MKTQQVLYATIKILIKHEAKYIMHVYLYENIKFLLIKIGFFILHILLRRLNIIIYLLLNSKIDYYFNVGVKMTEK